MGYIFVTSTFFVKYLKEQCSPEPSLQFSFKCFVNLWLIPKLHSKVPNLQTTFVQEISRHQWVKRYECCMCYLACFLPHAARSIQHPLFHTGPHTTCSCFFSSSATSVIYHACESPSSKQSVVRSEHWEQWCCLALAILKQQVVGVFLLFFFLYKTQVFYDLCQWLWL